MRGRFASLFTACAVITSSGRLSAEPAPAVPPPPPLPGATASDDGAAVADAVTALATWAADNHAHLGAAVMDVASGSLFASHEEHALLNPASNAKILTAVTVLDRMGPAYRFTTGLFGHVEGDTANEIVLRGNGDPSLGVAQLFQLSATLLDRGVSHVGRVLVDQSYFDDAYVPPAFEQQPNEWKPFRAPVSAVAVERNAVTLNVAATKEGQPASLWFDPPGVVGKVRGAVATRKSGNDVRFSVAVDGQRLTADVGGFVGASSRLLQYEKRVDDPRLLPGFALSAVMKKLGIDVRGDVALGGDSARERLASLDSGPLAVLVRELGKNSDNFYAEMLLKALGATVRNPPAHTQDGADAVMGWLTEQHLLEPGTVIRNGSGLFDANRVSAFELVGALRAAATNPRIAPDFLAQLAIGGVDGTLASRFQRAAKAPVIRAKTGTLDRVVALSGYVLAPPGRSPLAFSFLLSDLPSGPAEARARIDRAVEAIAAWMAR